MYNQITIIMYHYVRDAHLTKYPNINGILVGEFESQLKYLKKYYSFINIDDCIQNLQNEKCLPSNACLLTFDDGYIDHYETVFPILVENDIQGCFFPPAKAIIEHSVLDVNKIHFILASTKNCSDQLINDIYLLLDEYRVEYKLKLNNYYFNKLAKANRFDSKEVIFIKRLLQLELNEELRNIITDRLFKKYVTEDVQSFSDELYMNLNQLKIMSQSGMYIGSHGYNHYWLDKLSPEEQEYEINQSIDFLSLVGTPLKSWVMCYPYGAYNRSLLKILKQKKCGLAFTTKYNIASLSEKNAYTLERLDTNDFPKSEVNYPNKWTRKIIN